MCAGLGPIAATELIKKETSMEKVAHSLYGLPPSVSLNTFSHFGGLLKVSAWNHRSFLFNPLLCGIINLPDIIATAPV